MGLMSDETTAAKYLECLQLLTELTELAKRIVDSLIHEEPESQKGDYAKQVIWTIFPSVNMLIWGQNNNNSLAVMNGLRTLLECWGNTNYIFRVGSQGSDHYLTKMAEGAHQYQKEFRELRENPSLGLAHLKGVRWSGQKLTYMVEQLGEGPLFQYEYTSRYVHADVWATLNEFDIKNPDHSKSQLLGWGVKFVGQLLSLLSEEKIFNESLQKEVDDISIRLAALFPQT